MQVQRILSSTVNARYNDGTEEGCEAAGGCVTKYVWQKINESITKTVDEMDLKQLVDESKAVQNKAASTQMKCNN